MLGFPSGHRTARRFLNMLKLMQKKTLALVAACGSGEEDNSAAAPAAAAAAATESAGPSAEPTESVRGTMVAKLTVRSPPQDTPQSARAFADSIHTAQLQCAAVTSALHSRPGARGC